MSPYKKRRTRGLSNKVVATLAGACGAQTVAFVTNWIASGDLDRVGLSQLVGLALTALFGLAAGYRAEPDEQE